MVGVFVSLKGQEAWKTSMGSNESEEGVWTKRVDVGCVALGTSVFVWV